VTAHSIAMTPKGIAKPRSPSKQNQKPKLKSNQKQKKQIKKPRHYLFLCLLAILTGISLFLAHYFIQPYVQPVIYKVMRAYYSHITTPSRSIVKNQSIDYDEYQQLSASVSWDNQSRIRAFINENASSPLGISLRNRWLLFVAEHQDWKDFLIDYRPTNQEAVECYHLTALDNTDESALALSGVKRLWQAGYKMTGPCEVIFSKWSQSDDFQISYVWERLNSAIDQNDQASIIGLKALLPIQQQPLVTMWLNLRETPENLPKTTLPHNAITDSVSRRIFMDVLNQWVSVDVEQAIAYWNQLPFKIPFDEPSLQNFYLTASLHLALSGDAKAEQWFAKILPQYSTSESRAWQVRFALIHQDWFSVLTRIAAMPEVEQQENSWQYWKARALAATQQPNTAKIVYQHLATQRQYYGFLSAYQLHQALNIQQQDYPQDFSLLRPYQQQIDQIYQLYQNRNNNAQGRPPLFQALLLTQDLLNQLNPLGQYTLAHLFHDWQWDSEAMVIVNRIPYQNDLVLRFPMPHRQLIITQARTFQIDPAFVYALARQESNFHNDVASQAGGIGLLQLTLATAQQFEPNITEKALSIPKNNISISLRYLKRLMRQFEGHPLLVASAYNAGPQQTRRWQVVPSAIPADIWIETRPWGETRNYLKNTLAYSVVYQYLLNEKPDLSAFMQPIEPY